MKTKIYGIYGKSQWNIIIPTRDGRSYIECEFTKGVPASGGNYRPATFATRDEVKQRIIEDSPLFGSTIFLWREGDDDGQGAQPQTPAPAPKKESTKKEVVKDYPDVVDREGLIAVLKSLGAKAAVLVDEEAIKKFIENRGLTFPNYQF